MRSAVLTSCLGGFASGLVILGIGGRVLMRLLAFTTPEAPRFTWSGSLEMVGLAAAWGLLTGPLILLTRLRSGREWLAGPVFGLLVFVLAAVPFLLYSGFSGTLVRANDLPLAQRALLPAALHSAWSCARRPARDGPPMAPIEGAGSADLMTNLWSRAGQTPVARPQTVATTGPCGTAPSSN